MEDVFDSKIQQINFLTEENVKDKIEEAVAEIEIKPELFDDIYSKIDHTHTNFNNNLNVNGDLNVKKINQRLSVNGDLLRFWNPEMLVGDHMYFQIGKNHDDTGDCFWIQYTNPGKMYFKFYPPGKIMMENR